MKCKQHPSYQGRNEPLARCARCREIYEHANALAIARKERERHIANLRLERALRDAIGQIHDFEKHVAAIKALRESKRAHPIRPQQGRNTSEATAVVLATDWHFGSRIKPEQVNGLNRFDVATCKKRVETFFERVVRMIRKEQQDVKITDLVLFLGGDLINGSLHRDTEMSDEIAQPIEQAIQCQALVESGINYLLNHANISNITIPCCDGN